MDKDEKRSFKQMEQSHGDEYVYSANDHLSLEKMAAKRPRFMDRPRNHLLDVSSKIASLKASPSVVSLVSFSGEVLICECSGTIIEVEENKNVVMTSLNLIREPTEAEVAKNSLSDNLKIIIRSCDECSYVGEIWAYDFHFNILIVKFKSNVSLQPAKLSMIDDGICLDKSFELRPHSLTVKAGDPVVVVGRYFYRSFDLMASSGCLSMDRSEPSEYDCRELLTTSCAMTICGDGGPLINLAGEVIGIAFFEISPTSHFLPINIAYKLWNHYKRFMEMRHPSYGFEASNLYVADLFILERVWKRFPNISNGLLVEKVWPGSYAESSGLREDDIIIKCDGKDVKSFLEVWDQMWDKVGQVLELGVLRVDHCALMKIRMMVGEATQLNKFISRSHMKLDMDMDVDTEGHSHELEVFKDVYNKQNQVVWVIKIEGRVKSRSYESIYTGFTVRSDGYVMTCAHGGWHSWSGLTIKARRLDGKCGLEFGATIVSVKTKWDMCLLKIDLNDLKECDCGKLASGKMDISETIFVIGNPNEFVGSGLVGHVAYACTDAVEIDYNNDVQTCYNFKSEALTCKPAYRIMGHIWHSHYFNHAEIQDRDTKSDRRFEKNLQPRLPIIQCYGFVGGFGTSGAPIFNRNVESDGYKIGVHVTALQTFLKHAMPLQEVVKEDIEKVVLQGIGESSKDIGKKRKVSNVEEV